MLGLLGTTSAGRPWHGWVKEVFHLHGYSFHTTQGARDGPLDTRDHAEGNMPTPAIGQKEEHQEGPLAEKDTTRKRGGLERKCSDFKNKKAKWF